MLPNYHTHNQRSSWSKKGSGIRENSLGLLAACLTLLVFLVINWRTSSQLRATVQQLEEQLKEVNDELSQGKANLKSRQLEYEQLEASFGQTQRRLQEVTNIQSKNSAEIRKKDSVIKMLVDEKETIAQQNQERFREHQQHLDALQHSLAASDEAIAAYEKKISQMELTHKNRENDWIELSKSWREYEEDFLDHLNKLNSLIDTLSRELHKPVKPEDLNIHDATHPHPEVPTIKPKLRPESDFDNIHIDIPTHTHPDFSHVTLDAHASAHAEAEDTLHEGSDSAEKEVGHPTSDFALVSSGSAGVIEAVVEPLATNGERGGRDDALGGAAEKADAAVVPPSTGNAPPDFHRHHDAEYRHLGRSYHYDHYDPLDRYWITDGRGDEPSSGQSK